MDLLKAEIEKKKRLIENVASSSDKGPKKRKYIKQADLERIKEQEYLAKKAELERKREVYYFFFFKCHKFHKFVK